MNKSIRQRFEGPKRKSDKSEKRMRLCALERRVKECNGRQNINLMRFCDNEETNLVRSNEEGEERGSAATVRMVAASRGTKYRERGTEWKVNSMMKII